MVLAALLLPPLLAAQGITSAAVQGTIVAEDGAPIAEATVQLTNEASGRRWAITTRSDGRFLLEDVAIGAYRVEVRALGYAPETRSGVVLALGQRLMLDLTLWPVAIELPSVPVMATHDPILDAGHTGPAEVIPRELLTTMPNLGRSLMNVTLLSPQAAQSVRTPAIATGTGIAFDGQNRIYNSFQVDGGVHQDLYRGQPPGRESFARPVSLEALQEMQITPAPFDVRHGGFVGGLVNAVTRSGSNATHGSFFGYVADARLVRGYGTGGAVGDFTNWQYGGTLSGPIVRDRLHYFVSIDLQNRMVPDPGPLITDTAGGADMANIGISYENALRFHTILDTLYGLDAGSFGPVAGRVPAGDLFAKLTAQLATSSHLDLSFHYMYGNRQDFLLRTENNYFLSSFSQQEPATLHASRLAWTSVLGGRWSNELIASYLRQRDDCRPAASFPEVRVFTGPTAFLSAGAPNGCSPNTLGQDVLEIRNNATTALGRHAVGLGMHVQFLRFRDDLVNGSVGLWMFDNLDSLEIGRPRAYQRTLRAPAWDGGVEFPAYQVALYAQDRWNPTPALTITLGLRADVPFLPKGIPTNDSLEAALGADTRLLPSGHVMLSPRLGFHYDWGSQGRTFVRGGIGLFTGSMPYRWLSNAYRDDGTQELFLDCRRNQAPNFTPLTQPDTCVSSGPTPRLSFFDPNVRLPQSLKASLGVDRRLVGELVGTLDVLVTRATHQLYVTDANLAPPSGSSAGEADRPLYGTINATNGTATPTKINTGFGQVIRVSDRSGDHAISVAAQLRTRFGEAVEARAHYTYTRARDQMSLAHVGARAMLEGTVLSGPLENRTREASLFEFPHRVQFLAGMRLPWASSLSLLYTGGSGRPFTYTVGGDANADGMGVGLRQDAAYVPRDRADITMDGDTSLASFGTAAQQDSAYADLDNFIRSVACLREQRGRIVARNSCRNPWFGTLNARLTKTLQPFAGQSLELSADVYNLLNLINSDWGLSRYDGLTFGTDVVVLRGYDPANGRGIYEFRPPPRDQIEDLASRWQMEFSVRYVF